MASSGIISGLGNGLRGLFKGTDKPLHTKTDKPRLETINRAYPKTEEPEKRVLWLLDYFYREGSFEKIQFARKWMRNALIYQGYHELEWSEINVAWDILTQDSGDFAFPNNYYRTLILQGVRSYVQQESLIEPVPLNDDADAQGAAKAARTALEIIKKTVKYDYLRVIEAINLRLFGNSFRFAYYSKDPRYGFISADVYQDVDVVLSHGGSQCPNPSCPSGGQMEGQFEQCPYCGSPTQQTPPIVAKMPKVAGTVKYPKGEVMTEIVNPLEMYMRSSSYDLWHVPFLIRNRVVDRMGLQSSFQNINISPSGDEGGGEAYSTGGDLGLIYLQSLADLPGDPTQFAAWYERATAAAKALLIEGWIRPSQYFFDKELTDLYPDGLYGAKTGDVLLEARNDTIEDHWTHYLFNHVPGRIWGDGDDDLIPPQLKLDETDRLIQRNQGYNAIPLIGIDSQRVDKNDMISDPSTIVEVKSSGRPISEAFHTVQAQPLPNETWQWRASHLQDMQFHARQSPAAMGQHEKGINTFGGQESAASKSDTALIPNLMMWTPPDEMWARQCLKLASENWLDQRVSATQGISGRWEFEKLRGAALDMDKFTLVTRVMPIDPAQQDALAKATTSGLLNPQDPRVQRKAMQLYHLPNDLDEFYGDAKTQWEEIEMMKRGQQPQPVLIRDNDQVHIQTCREYMNSDECFNNPQLTAVLLNHIKAHMMNMAKSQMMQAAIAGASAQAPGAQPQQQLPPGQPQQEVQPHGGQVPPSPQKRQMRAEKGAIAKPNRPQPSEGNQWQRRRLT